MLATAAIPLWVLPPTPTGAPGLLPSLRNPFVSLLVARRPKRLKSWSRKKGIISGFLPVDPWAPTVDSQSIASQLFAASLFPYLGFLYFITKSKTSPKLTLFGFYFLLAFVGATTQPNIHAFLSSCMFSGRITGTVPAGIYAKINYGTSLSNVDWLHGGAEFLLTLTNLFVVIGLREALRKFRRETGEEASKASSKAEEKQTSA
ncbi:hypothetical protein EJ110_NYTH33908 [Nymphaea thermarum]|nr:hypothetical protein EJ110_NYTH33908 [Nymphaea thermarum]